MDDVKSGYLLCALRSLSVGKSEGNGRTGGYRRLKGLESPGGLSVPSGRGSASFRTDGDGGHRLFV